ncbi:YjgB family protein [Paenibacillus glycanilyticus]|uniref:YjgB family protein n=1 Tax=Paenibacillus glycanilyticus TaxID=126569 RepID=UPI0020422881|nr:YjgB family protein [Paenibacillus glycanilyticus]MCM3629764.1 YjgB family protein [Paenibacillus glycanilyticus]
MKFYTSMKKIVVASVTAGTLALTVAGAVPSYAAAAHSAAPVDAHTKAYQTLMSFYKPALKGQFPNFHDFTIGSTTRQSVIKTIGQAESPAKDSDDFDVYHAEMGHPGYAISYKLGKIKEMRYFGTNVERDTNLGGITVQMLVQHWGTPNQSVVIKSGKTVQKKVTYVRGKYQLEFIFDGTNGKGLNHINLVNKTIK